MALDLNSGYFNPCSIGMPLRISEILTENTIKMQFNPCCIGIPLRIDRQKFRSRWNKQFQSLLYWNTSENTTAAVFVSAEIRFGFNPCCIGIPLRIRG